MRRAVHILVLLAMGMACGLRPDELECELAAAHVEECCRPDYTGSFACTFVDGCGSYIPPPVEDMKLIQAQECEAIVAAGFCSAFVEGANIDTGVLW